MALPGQADGDLHPPWRLDVYGEGPLEPALTRKIEELGLQDVITLRGYVGIDAGLREAYERADAFLHVSWTEGMPQVLIEAFAARLPTVATDVGGVAALADDAALLVAPGDARAVADATAKTGRGRRAAHQVGRSWNRDRARAHDGGRSRRARRVPDRCPGMTVDVSVLTPVLNEERHIEDAVATMRSQRFEGELEFIFADGGSSDRTRVILEDLARAEPRIRVLDNPAGQTASGLNVALRAARGSIVARMDAHTLYPPEYLAVGVERLRRGDGVVWASGPQVPHGVDAGSRAVALALGSRLGTGGASFRHPTGEEIEASTGFTGVLDRSFLERVGGWDEGWPVNQDSELGARVAAAGGRMVVVPEMAAQYIPRSSVRALLRQYRRYGYYRAKTSRAHPESMRATHLIPPAIVLLLAVAAVGAPRCADPGAHRGGRLRNRRRGGDGRRRPLERSCSGGPAAGGLRSHASGLGHRVPRRLPPVGAAARRAAAGRGHAKTPSPLGERRLWRERSRLGDLVLARDAGQRETERDQQRARAE